MQTFQRSYAIASKLLSPLLWNVHPDLQRRIEVIENAGNIPAPVDYFPAQNEPCLVRGLHVTSTLIQDSANHLHVH